MCALLASPDDDLLFAIAEGQDGYFTMAQAEQAGFSRSNQSYHAKVGHWIREARGIYRLRRFPVSSSGYLVPWSLWSRDRSGVPQGVYSHATALALHGLSDANPARLHMTVPPGFRRNSRIPGILVLHVAKLGPGEITMGHGYRFTRAMRSIVDCAESGDADPDMLAQALREGLARGLITRQEVKLARGVKTLPDWMSGILGTS